MTGARSLASPRHNDRRAVKTRDLKQGRVQRIMGQKPRKKDGPQSLTASADKLAYASMIAEVRRLYSEGEVDAALDLAARIGEEGPELSRSAVPVIAMTHDALMSLPLDHRAGFMLTRIDGHSTVQNILDVAGMEEGEALEVLEKLVALGALVIVEREMIDPTFGEISLPSFASFVTPTPQTWTPTPTPKA